ncbi:Eco57I restriction-modification methylase domain-containing protein [Stutzerimonas kunmingensis]|uniref:Eco57I restriction-modification methylase domain-containing protein n=1 Tax=Stutzerimonas kunmingensis TaxID=1211807 RepID=UPI0028A1D530|nr:N-6 DNA methylase [Stutzerimonas kunmingensis]
MRQALDKKLRKQLENTVIKAREIAEQAAAEALARLSVGDASAASYLDADQRALRNRLRAHGRQLGDLRSSNGQQETGRLCSEVAYEHWHRMLFARFLEQNHLLMYDPHTALTLDECQELAADEGCADGWELAGKLAAKMLPQVFRADSPALAVTLAFNHVRELEKLIAGLDPDTFQAADSLGWVYQYWQAKQKKEVNDSGVKIGADELSPVTQLFTEPYMVQFLLDNSLGAWWVTHYPEQRHILPLTYLRTVGADSSATDAAPELPAAGTFDGWPEKLADFRMLDPCCGSGHFLVATLLMLVPMRMAAEGLSADAAIDAVLRQNLHGLELDQRCVELAAFAVALEAWRYPGASGYRSLPALNIACVGQRIQTPREQWLALAGDNPELKAGMARLYDTFSDAPILGSLIDPARSLKGDLLTADWSDVQPLLAKALAVGEAGEDDLHEAAITAKGLARAAELLGQRYQLVITNVPYLTRGKQSDTLKDFSERYYELAKNDLANVFLERCLELTTAKGVVQIVMPQNWLFLGSYKKQREHLLKTVSWNLLARLGSGAFDTISGEVVNVILLTQTRGKPSESFHIRGIDASASRTTLEKGSVLREGELVAVSQSGQLGNPDSRIAMESVQAAFYLEDFASSYKGMETGDFPRFGRGHWEVAKTNIDWAYLQSTVSDASLYSGREQILFWDGGSGETLKALAEELRVIPGHQGIRPTRGSEAWKRKGILVSMMRQLPFSIYDGHFFDNNTAAIVPKSSDHLAAILAFCSSDDFPESVRKIDQKLNVTNATLVKVPFDLAHWQQVAAELYPNGLPKPYSDDPTQWIFHGHPQPATEPLQVAVARLLGYRWPAESDNEMELSDEARAWIARSAGLNALADDDGIVCLPPVRGEKAAADRLENLLQAAFGADWTPQRRNQLLEQVGAKSLDAWLRDKFFEQHCKLFLHRPFIWHVWDGLRDGFSALVNYHKLTRGTLERLIYTYLGDWIRTQQHGVEQKLDGADIRLSAAQNLKARLEAILAGDAPYDIFVRWKPLAEQPIGWEPDLNDGVRLNIRPFMTAEVLRHNKKPKLNIEWKKDRGNDVPSAPWYTLGLQYGEKEGARINDHHLTLAAKKAART